MSALPAPKAFLPSDMPRHRLLPRAILAHAVAAANGGSPANVSASYWPRDPMTLALVTRAASSPATTTTAGWAAELSTTALGAFLGSLKDAAAAALFAASPRFDLAGLNQLTLPRASSTGGAAWTAEGAPIVVPQGVIAVVPLGPVKKLAIIESCTQEIADVSAEGGEAIITQLVRDAVIAQLDASLFSNTASSSLRPPGIVAGITASTAATGGGINAAATDLRTLTDAIVAAGGSGNGVLFFSSPGRAINLKAYFEALADRFYGSASIPSGTIYAVDPASFASAFGADPEIRVSTEATIHFE